jgi:hypothetical protein
MTNIKSPIIILVTIITVAGLAVLKTTSSSIQAANAVDTVRNVKVRNSQKFAVFKTFPARRAIQANHLLGVLDDWFLFLPIIVYGEGQALLLTATPTKEIILTATHTPTPTKTPQPGMPKDGSWRGEAVTDGYPAEIELVNFTVESGGSQIATGALIDTYYYVESGFWVCSGTVEWTVNNPISIEPYGSFGYSGGIVDKLTWEGNFLSETSVQGSFYIEKQTYVCGKALLNGTWTAEWQQVQIK